MRLVLLADMSVLASLSARVHLANWKGSIVEDMHCSANMVGGKESLATQIGSSMGLE